jgi:hypothetical protein
MPNLKDCIRAAREQGHITREEEVELAHRYDQLAKRVFARGSAKEQLIAELETEAHERKRRTLLTEAKRSELLPVIFGYRDARGRSNPAEALIWLLENNGIAGIQDVRHRQQAILAGAQRKLDGLLYEFRKGAITGEMRRRFGPPLARMENVVRELFGEASGDSKAKELAVAWSAVAEDLRQRFNAAGGAIGKLEKWGLPQLHNQEALLRTSFEEWFTFILPRLDREKTVNPVTGARYGDDELAVVLLDTYNRIRTEGWLDRDPTGAAFGRGALFRQHADHRFLHFKDGTAWLEYQREFGEGDPFAAMMGHLDVMARDIAFMEILGPNPDAMLTYLKQEVIKNAELAAAGLVDPATNPVADLGYVAGRLKRVDDMYAIGRGAANTPVNAKWANRVAAVRNIISSAALGSAVISSISDMATQHVTRAYAGLPATSQLALFKDVVAHFGRHSSEAVAADLILDGAVNVMHQQARYLGSISGRSLTSFINDRVLTLTGQIPFTQAGKWAFGFSFQSAAADEAANSLANMTPLMREIFERNGITAADWELIRTAPLYEPKPGVAFLRPAEIEEVAGRALAEKYLSVLLRTREMAVVESTWRSRSAVLSESRPGTLQGELLRSMAQFKSFSVAFAMLHGGTVFRDITAGSYARGALYAGGLLILTTAYGGLALQLKQITAGKDPRPMTDEKFWEAALLQGGGLGIYGDFLFSDLNRFGGGFDRTVAGPMVDRLNTLWNLTGGNAAQLLHGKKTNIGREALKGAGQMVPGSSAWFLRLAYERILMDQLQYLADPEAHAAFRRKVLSARKEYGQDFFWRPGAVRPDRGPDWSNAWRQ